MCTFPFHTLSCQAHSDRQNHYFLLQKKSYCKPAPCCIFTYVLFITVTGQDYKIRLLGSGTTLIAQPIGVGRHGNIRPSTVDGEFTAMSLFKKRNVHRHSPGLTGSTAQAHTHTHTDTDTHRDTQTTQALSHFQIRFHGNPYWDHVKCPSICQVPTYVVFVVFLRQLATENRNRVQHSGGVKCCSNPSSVALDCTLFGICH